MYAVPLTIIIPFTCIIQYPQNHYETSCAENATYRRVKMQLQSVTNANQPNHIIGFLFLNTNYWTAIYITIECVCSMKAEENK